MQPAMTHSRYSCASLRNEQRRTCPSSKTNKWAWFSTSRAHLLRVACRNGNTHVNYEQGVATRTYTAMATVSNGENTATSAAQSQPASAGTKNSSNSFFGASASKRAWLVLQLFQLSPTATVATRSLPTYSHPTPILPWQPATGATRRRLTAVREHNIQLYL